MGGMPSVSNRLRKAKVDEYIRLIMLRLLSINTILNTTLNNLLFLCYTSLFLIRVIYLSMIAKNCLSMALGEVSFPDFDSLKIPFFLRSDNQYIVKRADFSG